MSSRKEKISKGEYYHVFVRGVNKQQIFFDKRDYARFLLYILFFQSPITILNIGRRIADFIKTGDFGIDKKTIEKIIKQRYVEVIVFSFMPNHIHLILYEKQEGGISQLMKRSLGGFARYLHTKYGKTGHIFERSFGVVHITNGNQLLYLSTYVHKQPKELKEWKSQWEYYPWSSYQNFVGDNPWGNLLSRDIVLKQFKDSKEYAHFVKTSSAKEVIDDELLIDF